MQLTRDEIFNVRKAAHQSGMSEKEAFKNYEHIKRNPDDILQPGDPRFDEVWGNKQRKQKERRDQATRDARLEHEDHQSYEKEKAKRAKSNVKSKYI